MPVLRPRRASVRIWSRVSRTNASMPPRWMAPSSLVNELLMSCLDDMRLPLLDPRGASGVRVPLARSRQGTFLFQPSWHYSLSSTNALMMMCALAATRPSEPSLGFLERRKLLFVRRARRLRLLDRALLDPSERLLVRDQQHHVVASRGLCVVAVLPRGHRLTIARHGRRHTDHRRERAATHFGDDLAAVFGEAGDRLVDRATLQKVDEALVRLDALGRGPVVPAANE